jgi:hypothetical protein
MTLMRVAMAAWISDDVMFRYDCCSKDQRKRTVSNTTPRETKNKVRMMEEVP